MTPRILPLRELAPLLAGAVCLALAACGHPVTLAGAARAYAEGRWDEAAPTLERLGRGRSPDAPEARRLLAELRGQQRLAASVLIEKAGALREGPPGSRMQARAYLALARTLLGEKDRQAAAAARAIAEIDAWHEQRVAIFDRLLGEVVASETRCDPSAQGNALSQLGELRRELGRDDSLLEPAVAAAAACFAAGRDLDVITLSELALELRTPTEPFPGEAAYRLALAYGRLPPSPRMPKRAPPRQAREPGPADWALARAQALYHDGKVFEALVVVDDALAGLDRGGSGLRAQREAWRRDRDLLVGEYLERGESALAVQDPESAYDWYVRVLALDPAHDVALDRVHKIENLRRIRGSSRT